MKGQDVMTSNVACHAMLWTQLNKNMMQKSHKTGWFDQDHDQDHDMDHDSSEQLDFFDL